MRIFAAVIFSNFLFQDAETVSFEEQIISKDKYPYIFSRKIDAMGFLSFKYSVTHVKNVNEQLTELN